MNDGEAGWTPEPWLCIRVVNGPDVTYRIDGPDGFPISGSEANVRRIVACVNACAGITDPAAAFREVKGVLKDLEIYVAVESVLSKDEEMKDLLKRVRDIIAKLGG